MAVIQVFKRGRARQVVELDRAPLVVGRNPDCGIHFSHPTVSRRHLHIQPRGEHYFVEDLNSNNGTELNGVLLQGERQLADGDTISIGHYSLRFFVQRPQVLFSELTAAELLEVETATQPLNSFAKTLPAEFMLEDSSDSKVVANLNADSDSANIRLGRNPEAKLRALLQLSRSIGTQRQLDDVMSRILQALFEIFPQTDGGCVLLRDVATGELVVEATKARLEPPSDPAPISRSLAEKCLAAREAILTGDATQDERFRESDSVVASPIRATMCVPLFGPDEPPHGVIQLVTTQPDRSFDKDDLDVLASISPQAGLAIENARRYEQLCRLAEDELSSREQRLRLAVEQLPVILWTTDSDLRITSSRGAGLKALGLVADQVVGTTLHEFFQTDDPNRFPIAEHLPALAGRSMRLEQAHAGNVYQAHLEPLRAVDGRIIGTVGIALDITRLKQVEADLRDAHDKLEERVRERTLELVRSNEELEQFAYSVSHDLQAPLRSIAGFCQLLQKELEGKLHAKTEEWFGFVMGGVEHMQTLIDDVLELSRVTTRGKDFEPTNCEDLVDLIVTGLRFRMEDSPAEITRGPLPTVPVDRTQLRRLLENLLDNALKFRADRPLKIHVDCRQQKAEWVFSVSDNGIGIDPSHFDRIFVVFQRLHTRDEYPGTGIGLAVCRKIVERHSGRIWVESTPGEGTTVSFSLPADTPPRRE